MGECVKIRAAVCVPCLHFGQVEVHAAFAAAWSMDARRYSGVDDGRGRRRRGETDRACGAYCSCNAMIDFDNMRLRLVGPLAVVSLGKGVTTGAQSSVD